MLRDSHDSPKGIQAIENPIIDHRISFSEKFLKKINQNIFDSKKVVKKVSQIKPKSKESLDCSSLELEIIEKRSRQSNTPRFRISKQLIDSKNNPNENLENQIQTLGNSSNQFKFKVHSRNSSKQSTGFVPLTEDNSKYEKEEQDSSNFDSHQEDNDFINIKGHPKSHFKKKMMTISEHTQESFSKNLLTSLKGNKTEEDQNEETDPEVKLKGGMKTRSDFSGNLIRNTLSVERMFKKSGTTTRTDERGRSLPLQDQSVFGELREDSNDGDSRRKSYASGFHPSPKDRNIFSKKKMIELGVISSREDTIGMSQNERRMISHLNYPIDEKFSSQHPIFSENHTRISTRDFLLEKMMSSNEKLTKSALEKMLEQGQKSASMLKECFKDLLFKESQNQKSHLSTATIKQGEIQNKLDEKSSEKKYRRKKEEWKVKMQKLEKENLEQREKIVKLETLLESKKEMQDDKEKIVREGFAKEIKMIRERAESEIQAREKIENTKDTEIQEWKARLAEAEKKNEKLRDKLLQIDIWGTRQRLSEMRMLESPIGYKSQLGVDQIYSKSTIPNNLTRNRWDVRSQMDDPESRGPQLWSNQPQSRIKRNMKERSKSLFNLGEQKNKKFLENSDLTQKRMKRKKNKKILSERENKMAKEKRSNSDNYLDLKEISSTRSVGECDLSLSPINKIPPKSKVIKKNLENNELNKKRTLLKIQKMLKIQQCISIERKLKNEHLIVAPAQFKELSNKIESLRDFNQTTEMDDTTNFQTFQNSNKVIGSNNFFLGTSMKDMPNQKEELGKGTFTTKDIDFSKNVFLNSGLVSDAKELEQDLKKEKVVLINELNSETEKLKQEKVTSSNYMKLSGDLMKFLYCQALCIDTGLDTFEEFMEEEGTSGLEKMDPTSQENSDHQIQNFQKYPHLSMQAVKEVEEEHEVDTSPRKGREGEIPSVDIQIKSPLISETTDNKEYLKLPSDMKDALLSEKIETPNPVSINTGALLSQANERQTCESEIIQKTPTTVYYQNLAKNKFSHSLPNHKIPNSSKIKEERPQIIDTNLGIHKKWKSGKELNYKVDLANLNHENIQSSKKEDSQYADFPEINIDTNNLELTLREVSQGTKEIGRGMMEEYISGENRRYFINNGMKMRVNEEGIILEQIPLHTNEKKSSGKNSPLKHRNQLYNQTYSNNTSPDISNTKLNQFQDSLNEKNEWNENEENYDDDYNDSDDFKPAQQNFLIEDEGNIYMNRHQRQLKERRLLMKEDPLPDMKVETVDLEQALIPQDFDPDSPGDSPSKDDSEDEELNIYELSSKHVRSSFGSMKDPFDEIPHSLSSKNVSNREIRDVVDHQDFDFNLQSSFRKNKSNRSKDGFGSSLQKNRDNQMMSDDLFFTMKERNDYSNSLYTHKKKHVYSKDIF